MYQNGHWRCFLLTQWPLQTVSQFASDPEMVINWLATFSLVESALSIITVDFKQTRKFYQKQLFLSVTRISLVLFCFVFLSIFIFSGNTRQHLVLVVALCLTFFCQLAFFFFKGEVRTWNSCLLRRTQLVTSSFLISSSRGQSCAKGSPSRFCRCSQGVVKMREYRIELCCWLTCISCCIVSFLTALHLPVKSWHWSSKEVLMVFFSHSPAWWEPNGWGRSKFKASHFHCLAGCKARTFWMWSLAYFGKVIKFSEVGQLFLSLSGHTFNAWFVLNAVKVSHFLHEKVSPLWGNVW